jgi:hypothetical protein
MKSKPLQYRNGGSGPHTAEVTFGGFLCSGTF